jgi:Flp pilus assembly protein TadG
MSKKGTAKVLHALGAPLVRITSDERGTTAVEFSLIAVPFIGILMAIFQTGLVLFTSETLEAAVGDASRAIMTGQVQGGSISTVTAFRDNLLCTPTVPRRRILPSFIDCSRLIVDVQQAHSFSATDTARNFYANNQQTFNPGGAGCIVVVRVAYPLPIVFPILAGAGRNTAGQVNHGGGLKYMIVSTMLFRNEPFSTTPAAC